MTDVNVDREVDVEEDVVTETVALLVVVVLWLLLLFLPCSVSVVTEVDVTRAVSETISVVQVASSHVSVVVSVETQLVLTVRESVMVFVEICGQVKFLQEENGKGRERWKLVDAEIAPVKLKLALALAVRVAVGSSDVELTSGYVAEVSATEDFALVLLILGVLGVECRVLVETTVVTETEANVPTVPDGKGTNVPLERGNGGTLDDVDETTPPVLLLLPLVNTGAEVALLMANGGNVTVVDGTILVPMMTGAEVALDIGNGAKLADADDRPTPPVPVPVRPGTAVELDSGNGTVIVDVDEDTKLAVTVMVASGRPELVLEKGNGGGGAAESVLKAMVPVPVPATPGAKVEFKTVGIGMIGRRVLETPVPVNAPVPEVETIGIVEFDSGKGGGEAPPPVARLVVEIAGGVLAKLPVRSVVEPFKIDLLDERETFGVVNEDIDGGVMTSGLVTLVTGNGTVTVVDGTVVVMKDMVTLSPKEVLEG